MQNLQNAQNTQRVISNDKLIGDSIEKPMPTKKKVVIGVAIFITIAAIVGIAVGLYFHFKPNSTHLQTVVSQTNDGTTTYASTRFLYSDNNMVGDSVNETFTIMFAGLNGGQVQQRMLQSSQQEVNADTTLHYTHDSGIKIKFRGNEVLNISVPIDQVVEYIAQQEDPAEYARLLQDLTQYGGEDQTVSGQDIFDSYRAEVLQSIQSIYPTTDNINIHMRDVDMYEMDYDENSGSYRYTNASVTDARRRLWSFRHFFHKVGNFVKRAAGDVVHFVKKDGPKILKYGAIAALAGIDIAAKGPSGISDAVKMFKSGNVLTSLEMAVEGVATRLPAYLSIPIEFIGQACFSHPPKMHCTKSAALNAAKTDVLGYVKKHALSTILSLLE